MADKTELRRR